jgi:hypothetical protein
LKKNLKREFVCLIYSFVEFVVSKNVHFDCEFCDSILIFFLLFVFKFVVFSNFSSILKNLANENRLSVSFSSMRKKESVDTLIRRWISLSNQRWIVRHYLFTWLTHSIRLIIIISIRWFNESFQLTIHSRINDHFIDYIISRFYLMTFNDYVTNQIFNMWAKYLICKKIENHLYETLCHHLIKTTHHLQT